MANILSVSNAEELIQALASVRGGDTIELAGGNYGDLSLIDNKTDFNVRFGSEVTIRSADASQPASFSGMNLSGVSNLSFDGVVFDYMFKAEDPVHIKPFSIGNGSENISIRNSIFDGDIAVSTSAKADGYGHGTGLNVRDASNITVENNEFYDWHRGAIFADAEDLTVTGNDIHSIRSDGLNFIEVQSVLIEGNYIHDFSAPEGSSDHRDMIQFWTKGTDSPTTDVVIRGNVLDIGEGAWAQSIFMRNEEVDMGRAGTEMYYQNILIENNTIYNGHSHGITVGETDGLTIQNNSVLQAQSGLNDLSGGVSIPKINVKTESTSVTIENNITSAINGLEGQSDWTVSDNAIVQPSDYKEHFITSTIDAAEGRHSFTARLDSIVEQLGAGSDATQFPGTPDTLTPLFQVHSDGASEQSLIFDASLTAGPQGIVTDKDANFIWKFGDGSTATGRVVKHDFATPGHYDTTLTVIAKDGTTSKADFTVGIAGDALVQFDAQSGLFETLGYGEKTALDSGALQSAKGADEHVLKLGGEGSQASISSSEISRFFGTDAFEMSMTLKADNAASWGEIARIHTSLTTSVDRDGNFVLELFPINGDRMKIISEGIAVNDGAAHDILIQFDGKAGIAKILIDGEVTASESVLGSLGNNAWSLNFGNPWGKRNFDGELSAFVLSADTDTYAIYEGSTQIIPNSPVEAPQATMPEPDTAPEEPDRTAPEQDPVTGGETEPEDDAGLLLPLLRGGYKLDIAGIEERSGVLRDDTHVVDTQHGQVLYFDGQKDYVNLGRLTEFEQSQKIAFSVDFTSDGADGAAQRLVWNHTKFGLTLESDGIRVHAANNDDPIWKGFKIEELDLNDGNRHSATVMVDAETDRLQVVVDDVLVFEEESTDFDFVGGRESVWSLGTAWNRWFDGEVYDFQVSDDFTFHDQTPEDGTVLV